MSADSPRRVGVGGIGAGGGGGGVGGSRGIAVAATVPPQVVSDRSILDSAIGFINDVTLAHQPLTDPKDTITWARFESAADISDPRYGEDWELEGNVAPPLLLVLGYGLGVQVWAIPANGEAVEVLSWRHGIVSALRVLPTPAASATIDEHERADEAIDMYVDKRPLIALVDGTPSSGTQPQFCAVNFITLKTGTQVKTIKFKNPVLDVLANRCSIVITFHERIAVFDARTLDDRLSITTCYPSPGINPNPVTLGPRWLAYAENKLLHTKRSGAGCDGEGVASYTATVLNAAKSLGKGLRELGEHVAAGLTGTTGSGNTSKSSSFESGSGPDLKHAGVVTILDIKNPIKDYSPNSGTPMNAQPGNDPIVAHFIAHSEALVAMEFDNSGMLLLTADRRGHDFHIFRIQPHSVGASLAAVHHLYVLHRGDTSAKVQNIAFSLDSRWVAVSTLRGTTHVFPITPYGGAMGVRTHTSLHVVNKLSRFHRSAGLSADGRSSSPISHSESTTFVQSLQPYHNPTLPPFPRPTVVLPLAQLRQPLALGSPPSSAGMNIGGKTVSGSSSGSSQRQRLSSLSDDNGKSLSVCAIFAKSRSWLLDPPNVTREAPHRMQRKAVDSLFVMAGHGALIQYDLDTKLASNVAKEKICDDTPIELEVAAKAQWNLGRRKDGSQELKPPLSLDNWLIKDRNSCMLTDSTRQYDDADDRTESWLSQVEIITHAGPHRRLWMGPQFVFKTYNTPSGSNLSHVDAEAVEIGVTKPTTAAAAAAATSLTRTDRSSPLNMPLTATGRAAVPVLIESGSYSSIEQSPKLMDRFRHDHLDSDFSVAHGDTRLKEDLADAMRESPSVSAAQKDIGRLSSDAASSENIPFYDALTEHDHDNDTNDDDDDDQAFVSQRSSASVAALASALPNIYSYDTSSSYESLESLKHKQKISIEKVVNPLGTVTTVTAGMSAEMKTDILDEVVSQLATEDCVIHENCDEALFRPVVAIFCDDNLRRSAEEEAQKQKELCQPPEVIGNKLIVPVIAKEVDAELSRKEKEKTDAKTKQQQKKDDVLGSYKVGNKSKAIAASVAPVEIKQKESNVPPAITQRTSKEHLKHLVAAEATVNNNSEVFKTPQLDTKIVSNKIEKNVTKAITKTTSKSNVMEKSSEPTVMAQIEPTKTVQLSTGKTEEIKQDIRPQLRKSIGVTEETGKTDKLTAKSDAGNSVEDVKSIAKVCSKTANDNIISSTSAHTAPIIEKTLVAEYKTSTTATTNFMDLGTKSKKIEPMETPTVSIIQKDEYLTMNREEEKSLTKLEIPTRSTKTESPNKSQISNVEEISKPIKAGKSKKQKSNTSASNSDNDEIIEVIPKRKSIGEDKICSLNSDESSLADLSNSNLHCKTDEMSLISVSFSKTKEKVDTKNMKGGPLEAINVKDTIKLKPKEVEKNKMKSVKSQDVEKESSKNSASTISTESCAKVAPEEKYEISKEPIKSGKACKLEIVKIKSVVPEKDNVEGEKKENTPLTATKKSSTAQKEEPKVETSEEPSIATLIEKQEKCTPADLKCIEDHKEKNPKSEQIKSPKKNNSKETTTQEDIEITTTVTLPLSPNKKGVPKEKKQTSSVNEKETVETKPVQSYTVDTKKTVDERKISIAATSSSNDETDACDNASKKYTPSLTTTAPSVWKTMSGLSKNFDSSKGSESNFPSLGKAIKVKKSIGGKQQLDEPTKETAKIPINDALLHETTISVKTIDDLSETFGLGKSNKKLKKFTSHELSNFPLLKPLDALPPLPVLEPLEVITSSTPPAANNKGRSYREAKDISLINFESPLQENPALERKITPPPRGFTEQNLILALCGSLHYENENPRGDKVDFSPTLSLTRSNSGIGEQSVGDYKSLTENDEPYMSLEQSSQDTNTTNTATTNEKFSSSPNSSASEDIIIVEEKKMTKKQRRKKMQIELENQKEKVAAAATAAAAAAAIDVDEELRPLIGGMCDSFTDTYTDHNAKLDTSSSRTAVIGSMELLTDSNYCGSKAISCSSVHLGNSTNTEDSEGPMPATTSDDNIIVLSTTSKANVQHKLKTKKLEHKINLIAAIEAATSSSTSSAEESGMETSRRSPDLDIGNCGGGGALISVAATPVLPHQMASTVSIQQNVTKKKTKRRKR